MRCDADEKCVQADDGNDYSPGSRTHTFAGYGWFVQFHPACCPGHMDGSTCLYDDHPAGWIPEEGYAEVVAHEEEARRRWARKF